MNFAILIFGPMTNLVEPLLAYFGLVIFLDFIRTMIYSD